jgi:hypothetical protein
MKQVLHTIWTAIVRFIGVDPVLGAHGRGTV